jgi:hypothetical protein
MSNGLTEAQSETLNTTTFLYIHRSNVECWRELSAIAQGDGSPEMSEEQRDAYRLLPGQLDNCQDSYLRIPESARPAHYLLSS